MPCSKEKFYAIFATVGAMLEYAKEALIHLRNKHRRERKCQVYKNAVTKQVGGEARHSVAAGRPPTGAPGWRYSSLSSASGVTISRHCSRLRRRLEVRAAAAAGALSRRGVRLQGGSGLRAAGGCSARQEAPGQAAKGSPCSHDLGVKICDMDESTLTLGTIDVSYLPNSSEYSVGRCKHASEEWDKFFNPSIPSLGLRNVIYINETHTRHRGWLARRLSYVLFVQERDVHKGMFATNVTENVLNSRRVQEAIAEVAAELNPDGSAQQHLKAMNKVKKKAKKILQEMVATVSPAMIRY
ncbi:Glycerol-3-phosphate acyltransferase 1, mitochondrial [Galemys pyrenaicus]|uniref:glycerol-3-phosphate 1-O-acyltransferase n=1 Tax=Galemys pyrenaicus TaxID=202257 RepID=A0A8J6DT67_GALPY|nr:Glycerol-3-phosphate acyltransferase 1, mitochondrial [Galemys pyrenaicus]